MNKIDLVIASPPEYERLVVEIEIAHTRLLRVSMEGDEAMVEFDSPTPHAPALRVTARAFAESLARAVEELTRTYDRPK